MVKEQLIVRGKVLHSKKARDFVDVTSKLKSSVYLEIGNRRINAKSIIGVLSMDLQAGDRVWVLINGEDEISAMDAIKEYVE